MAAAIGNASMLRCLAFPGGWGDNGRHAPEVWGVLGAGRGGKDPPGGTGGQAGGQTHDRQSKIGGFTPRSSRQVPVAFHFYAKCL